MTCRHNWMAVLGCSVALATMPVAWAQTSVEPAVRPSAAGQSEQNRRETGAGQRGATGANDSAQGAASSQRSATGATAGQPGAAGQQGGQLDQHIAACLLLGNQEEVALAQFAQERSQNDAVKQFAQHMIEQHQQAIAKIQQASPQLASLNVQLTGAGATSAQGGAGANASRGADNDQSSQRNATQSGVASQNPQSTTRAGDSSATSQTAAAGAQGQGAAHQGIQLAKDIKEQCLQLTQRELSEKQGADFDKAYIGQQLVAHTNMLAELQASQKYAGQELQPIIREGEQMTQQHLSQAKQIMEQLKDQHGTAGAPQAAQRPNATQPQR